MTSFTFEPSKAAVKYLEDLKEVLNRFDKMGASTPAVSGKTVATTQTTMVFTPPKETAPVEPAAEEPKKYVLNDVISAIKEYATKFGREKAGELLESKFKVKSVRDLQPEQFGDVIKAAATK